MESSPLTSPSPAESAQESAVDVEVQDLTVTFGGKVTALAEVSLKVERGEFVCLLGPSGCGKTTLLNVMSGFVKPTAGLARIGGQPVGAQSVERGIVFQEYALFPWRTARRNVEFGLEMQGVPKAERRERAMEFLRLVKLEEFAETFPHHLSGGMKQRVAIARALAYDPKLLLMDEPFGALDSFTREKLQTLLVDVWQKTGKTIVYVTHNIGEAVYLGDRIVLFATNPGRIDATVKVDLPRPRDQLSPDFLKVQKAVTEKVLEDIGGDVAVNI